MITEAEYWKLQIVLEKKGGPKPRSKDFAFAAGMMTCRDCGSPIVVDRQKKKLKSGKVLSWEYYRCIKRNGPCNQEYLERRDLEQQICVFLDRVLLPDEFFEWTQKAEMAGLLEPVVAEESSASDSQKRRTIQEIENELTNLITMRTKDFIDDETFVRQKILLEGERSVLSAAMVTSSKSWLEPLEKLREFSSRSQFWFVNGTPEIKRTILAAVAHSNLSLHNKNVRIQPVEPFAFGAKEIGCAHWLGLTQDLRTFFEDNPDWKLPQLPELPIEVVAHASDAMADNE